MKLRIMLPRAFLALVHFFCGTLGLRLLRLDVPPSVIQGEGAWLNCTLDLESDDLYSVKWYKDDVEFYRYLPSDSPTGQKYDIPGVRLDLSKSSKSNVYLRESDQHTEGMFRCEASAESPTFQTVEGEKPIKIYVLPQGGPVIEGSQFRYDAGDFVNITCRSSPSKPAADLQWFINGRRVKAGIEISYPTITHEDGLQTTQLGLTFEVQPMHLFHGLVLRCTATVSQTYSTVSEELLIGHRMDVTTSSVNSLSVVSKDGPIITGRKSSYKPGDLLNMNCSSAKSNPPPELNWFLNDERVKSEYIIHYPTFYSSDGAEASTIGLRLRLQRNHLEQGEDLRLRCTATLSRIINTRSEERRVDGNRRNSGLHAAENSGKVSERSSNTAASVYNGITTLLLVCILWAF